MTICALWYWQHFSLCVDIEDEAQAASTAVWMEDAGEGAVVGVQFEDGRFVPVGEWEAYRAKRQAVDAEYEAATAARVAAPPRNKWEITPPFEAEGHKATLWEEPPSWVGISVREGKTK